MIYILFILLAFTLMTAYLLNKRDLTTPSLIFVLSFFFSTVWACIYAKKWDMQNMYINTVVVIFLGVVEFLLIALAIKVLFKKKYGDYYKEESCKLELINVDIFVKIVCIIFCLITIFWNMYIVLKTTNHNITEYSQAALEINRSTKFTSTIVKQPKLFGLFVLIINGMGYWFLYVAINNFIARRKIDISSIIISFLWIINSVLRGTRADAINFIIAGVVIAYVLLKRKCGYGNKLKLNLYIKILIVILPIIILITFPIIGSLLGRNTIQKPMDYLAKYCGAQIKNLDTFLLERDFSPNYIKSKNCQTFNILINWVGLKLGFIDKKYVPDLPYRQYNGYNLGNVYTTFYPYIYDFGYKGVVLCVAIMAVITQIVYEKLKRSKVNNKPNIWILTYSYMFGSIILSFFGNVFYAQVFNRAFICNLIFWYLANHILIKFKLKTSLEYIKKIKNLNKKRGENNE